MITLYEISTSYGLFETKNTIVTNLDIGTWEIKVNDCLSNEETTFIVDNINVVKDDNVLEGKFAPSLEGYFDIVIDSMNTDVSIRYDISYDISAILNKEIVVSLVEDTNGKELVLTNADTYTGIISLDDIKNGEKHTIRVHIIWHNNESNNYTDSLYGISLSDGKLDLNLPVTITLSQYLGEEVAIYTDGVF